MSDQPKDLEFELSDIDSNQIPKYTYSDTFNATRVVLVGGQKIEADVKFPENFQMASPKIIEVEKPVVVIQKEIVIQEVEKPVIVEKHVVEFVDKPFPVIQKEIVIQEVIKEVVVIQKEIVEVEKPVVVIKEKFVDFPIALKAVLVAQSLALIGLLLVNIIKH